MQSSAVTGSGVIPFPQEPATEVDPRFLGFEQFVDENVIARFWPLSRGACLSWRAKANFQRMESDMSARPGASASARSVHTSALR